MQVATNLPVSNHDRSVSPALMYSFFKVQPRSKIDEPTVYESVKDFNRRPSALIQPEHLPQNNLGNFTRNGLQDSVQVQQPVSNVDPESSEAYDETGDRRKRRKVSIEPENQFFESKQWNLLPPPRIVGNRQPVVEERTAAGAAPADVVSPRKKRGRPPKALAPNSDKQGAEEPATASDTPEPMELQMAATKSPKATGSGRKKSMRLTAKGTLLSSPTSSQERRPKHKAASPRGLTKRNPANLTLKNGKFIQSRTVKLKYCDVVTGEKIDAILASDQPSKPTKITSDIGKAVETTGKTTHPFFLGKLAARPQGQVSGESDVKAQDSHDEEKKITPWKDIVFKTKKPSFSKALQKAAWPPHAYQHVGRLTHDGKGLEDYGSGQSKQKAKQAVNEIAQSENVLAQYTATLFSHETFRKGCQPCERLLCTSEDALLGLLLNEDILAQHPSVQGARAKATTGLSPFDRGLAPGPLPWSQKHSPTKWQEVLQPDCQQLYNWLKSLAIHHVQSGTDKGGPKLTSKRKKKLKKRDDELSDFIVNDFDDEDVSKIKNAILIVGPNGCGKTASVFAVAKQLGFEVFEIHPGMRRSQKDIFDKVGDMAKNHLVQSGSAVSRDSSVLPETDGIQDLSDPAQQSINTLFSNSAAKAPKSTRSATPQPTKEQKQSLILFEEVDHIFDDDRGFWSGVQALIENSKRPVIMTCNTLQGIPLDELDLFSVLTYSEPRADVVGEYLSYLALAEGHIIEPDIVRKLYSTKRYDLRATMMELDQWCQMTIGSDRGGLDWFPQYGSGGMNGAQKPRVFSKDTFRVGLDLLPSTCTDLAENFTFMDHSSDVPMHKFLEYGTTARARSSVNLPEIAAIAMSCSDAVLLDQSVQAFMAASMWPKAEEDSTSLRDFARRNRSDPAYKEFEDYGSPFDILHPLSMEKPVFPPSQGRLAPSLDEPRKIIATDLAPYVRSIAAYDLGLEAYRDEVSSSQGKKMRTTRAARAAAEGGDKSSTRPERWLPTDLDLKAVLNTGGDWPRWFADTASSRTESITMTEPPAGDHGSCDQLAPGDVNRSELVNADL